MDGYVARFDSDIVLGDNDVMPNIVSCIPGGQLSNNVTASETSLTSHATLSSKPSSTVKQLMTNTMRNICKGCCVSVVKTFIVNRIYNCHKHVLF